MMNLIHRCLIHHYHKLVLREQGSKIFIVSHHEMRDVLFFWSVIFQILGVKNVARGTADLSWDKGVSLDAPQDVLLFVVLGSGLFDLGILMFLTVYLMSRIWSWWLHVSQVCRIILLIVAVTIATKPASPTNAYYATCEAIIFAGLSFILKCVD